MFPFCSIPQEGVSRSSRNAEWNAVAATASARDGGCRAVNREQRQARYDTTLTASSNGLDGERTPTVEGPAKMCADGEVVWSCRPGSVRQVLRRCLWPNRVRASAIRRATGAIVHRSPRRARRTPLKPSRREGRDVPASPVVHPVRVLQHTRDFGCQPAPGLPCAFLIFRRAKRLQNSGERRREHTKACPLLRVRLMKRSRAPHSVIANVATQSRIFPRWQSGLRQCARK
jgi:hypothetical protein